MDMHANVAAQKDRSLGMALPQPVQPVKLVCGLIGVDEEVLTSSLNRLQRCFGPADVRSRTVPFDFTDYYSDEMGEGLLRQWAAFEQLIDPGGLAGLKRQTNELEREFARSEHGEFARRVNLDPGYVTAAKLVLATTKDFSHRIYLSGGIYAEVTLNFTRHGLRCFDWTYPDFKSGAYDAFLKRVRSAYMNAVGKDDPGQDAASA